MWAFNGTSSLIFTTSSFVKSKTLANGEDCLRALAFSWFFTSSSRRTLAISWDFFLIINIFKYKIKFEIYSIYLDTTIVSWGCFAQKQGLFKVTIVLVGQRYLKFSVFWWYSGLLKKFSTAECIVTATSPLFIKQSKAASNPSLLGQLKRLGYLVSVNKNLLIKRLNMQYFGPRIKHIKDILAQLQRK